MSDDKVDGVVERIVDRVIIRGDPLTEPEVSESWLKIRAIAAIVTCALPGIIISTSSPGIGMGIAAGAGASATVLISRRINERRSSDDD